MRIMIAAGAVLVALGVVGCGSPTTPVTPPPAGGGSIDSGSGGGSADDGSGGVQVTSDRAVPQGNGVLHSPIQLDPTIPQFQPLYGTASYAEFRSVLWSYFDGLCADHCGVHVVADYECADRDSASCTVDHVDFTNPVHVGDTITVVLTNTTTDSSDSSVPPDSPDESAVDSAVSSAPNGG